VNVSKASNFYLPEWEQLLSLSPSVHIPEHHGKCPSEFILCAHLNSSAVIWIQPPDYFGLDDHPFGCRRASLFVMRIHSISLTRDFRNAVFI
jgi:hypothetical protein